MKTDETSTTSIAPAGEELPPVHIRHPSCAVCENVRALTDVSERLLWAGASTFEVAWLVMVQVGEV